MIRQVNEHVAVIDEAAFPRSVAYQVTDRAIVISRRQIVDDRWTYNPVGLNPRIASYNLSGLWENLRILENSERVKRGLIPLEPAQNWGGREVAGGSPKDDAIGSGLTLEQVASTISRYLAEQPRL